MPTLILAGDINLMGVSDPQVPFAQVGAVLRAADLVFANLECCFYEPQVERSVEDEGFYASPAVAAALQVAGVGVVGNANNVNFGAPAIRASLTCLERLGIPCTGAGVDAASAWRPVVVTAGGLRFGFQQRTSVYWTRGHEAGAHTPGVATLRAHTAYRPRVEDLKTLTRPGVAPEVLTWADPAALERLRSDLVSLTHAADVVVASHHWGLYGEVLDYQRQIAHAAIDAGADVVFGHGPHTPLPVEMYRGKPIFYGAGSFSFETGHGARKHPDWLGMLPVIEFADRQMGKVAFRFVRHDARNQTVFRNPLDERDALAGLQAHSRGVSLRIGGDEVLMEATDAS